MTADTERAGTRTRHDRIMAEAERIKALGEASESQAPYPVNQPTIGAWLDAMGYDNDRFRAGSAGYSASKPSMRRSYSKAARSRWTERARCSRPNPAF